jgi:tRNA(Ile)-lysidine synthase
VPAAADSKRSPNSDELAARIARLAGTGPVALAVSGGSDSAALLQVAADWASGSDGATPAITVLTVDHGLRQASAGEAETVRREARALGLAHETLVWHGDKPDSGLAASARTARYDLMTRWCTAHGVQRLLVAHTQDDQAETLVMRLARGSGVDGLSAMAPETLINGIAVVRPFLDVSRAQLRRYLEELGKSWIDDPTNEDENFERVRIRKALAELDTLGVSAQRIALSARRLQRARRALEGVTGDAVRRHVKAHEAGYCTVAAGLIAGESEDVVVRVLANCLTAVGGAPYPPRQAALEDLCRWLEEGGSQRHTLGGCRISLQSGEIEVVREAGRMSAAPLILRAGEVVLWDGRFRVGYEAGRHDNGGGEAITVQPLLREGCDRVKSLRHTLPARLREGLVSFWRNDHLLAVPHLAFRDPEAEPELRFTAEFCNFSLLEGGRVISDTDGS